MLQSVPARAVRLHRPAAPGMFWTMHAGRAPRGPKGAATPKRAATPAHDFDWTAIAIVVAVSVAIAVVAFWWFFD